MLFPLIPAFTKRHPSCAGPMTVGAIPSTSASLPTDFISLGGITSHPVLQTRNPDGGQPWIPDFLSLPHIHSLTESRWFHPLIIPLVHPFSPSSTTDTMWTCHRGDSQPGTTFPSILQVQPWPCDQFSPTESQRKGCGSCLGCSV